MKKRHSGVAIYINPKNRLESSGNDEKLRNLAILNQILQKIAEKNRIEEHVDGERREQGGLTFNVNLN